MSKAYEITFILDSQLSEEGVEESINIRINVTKITSKEKTDTELPPAREYEEKTSRRMPFGGGR